VSLPLLAKSISDQLCSEKEPKKEGERERERERSGLMHGDSGELALVPASVLGCLRAHVSS